MDKNCSSAKVVIHQSVSQIEFADSVTFVAFNFDGSLLATASMDGVIM
jgi:hypothetical protein